MTLSPCPHRELLPGLDATPADLDLESVQPAQAPAVELEQPASLFPSLERLAWERGR